MDEWYSPLLTLVGGPPTLVWPLPLGPNGWCTPLVANVCTPWPLWVGSTNVNSTWESAEANVLHRIVSFGWFGRAWHRRVILWG